MKWKKCFFCASANGHACLCMALCFISLHGSEIAENAQRAHPTDKFHERTFFERRMQIKTNFMLAACFNNQQKIDIICQVLIQIALIRSPSGDGLLPWSTLIFVWVTLELQRKDLLNPSFVEFFPWELAVFVQFFQLTCWSASYPFRYKLKSSV